MDAKQTVRRRRLTRAALLIAIDLLHKEMDLPTDLTTMHLIDMELGGKDRAALTEELNKISKTLGKRQAKLWVKENQATEE